MGREGEVEIVRAYRRPSDFGEKENRSGEEERKRINIAIYAERAAKGLPIFDDNDEAL